MKIKGYNIVKVLELMFNDDRKLKKLYKKYFNKKIKISENISFKENMMVEIEKQYGQNRNFNINREIIYVKNLIKKIELENTHVNINLSAFITAILTFLALMIAFYSETISAFINVTLYGLEKVDPEIVVQQVNTISDSLSSSFTGMLDVLTNFFCWIIIIFLLYEISFYLISTKSQRHKGNKIFFYGVCLDILYELKEKQHLNNRIVRLRRNRIHKY